MEISDLRTGELVHTVADEEETLHALGEILDANLRKAFNRFVGRSLCDADGHHMVAAVGTTSVLRRSRRALDDHKYRREAPFQAASDFDVYTAANATDWPVCPSTLRTDPALAEAGLDVLAAHLNTALRRECAWLVTECADLPGARSATAWEDFLDAGRLHGATVEEAADAIASGAANWAPLCDWTPAGGAYGDPFTVCRYTWGPLQFALKLDPHELVQRHLAGDADLALYRGVLDYGNGPQEIIWPHQHFSCCGRNHPLCDEARWPCRPRIWGQSGTEILTAAVQCTACGAISSGSWLTFRPLDHTEESLARIERLDTIPAGTLAATANGLLTVKRGAPIV